MQLLIQRISDNSKPRGIFSLLSTRHFDVTADICQTTKHLLITLNCFLLFCKHLYFLEVKLLIFPLQNTEV